MIVSKRRKTTADAVLSSTVTCNKCELCYGVIYRSKRIRAIATHLFTVATHLELNCAAFEGSFATH